MLERPIVLSGGNVYTTFIEPFLSHASGADEIAWTAWRDALPAPEAPTVTERAGMCIDGEVVVHRGPLSIERGLELRDGGILLVLGDLSVRGGVMSARHDYSAIVVRGKLTVDRLYVSGDVIAFGGIAADVLWGVGNDHVTCTPVLEAKTYVAEDRGDIIGRCDAALTIADFDVAEPLSAHFAGLDPNDEASICAFLGFVALPPAPPGEPEAGEKAELDARLRAAWDLPVRRERVKAIRAVYAVIKKRRLAGVADLLVDMIERYSLDDDDWSPQEELHLLADLRRADLLQALPEDWLGGTAHWIPELLKRARK